MIWANKKVGGWIENDGLDESPAFFEKYEIIKVKAYPEIKDTICPACGEKVIPKCGSIKTWHFAHESLKDCDSFSEPESEWHIGWKNEFPKEQQEVVVEFMGEKHRADILLENTKQEPWGKQNYHLIIELQNSSISLEEVREREEFYDNMIWLFNGETFAKGLNLRRKDIITFRWKNPPKIMWYARKSINIHLKGKIGISYFNGEYIFLNGEYIFQIKKIYPKCPCGGWGVLLTKEQFLKRMKDGAEED